MPARHDDMQRMLARIGQGHQDRLRGATRRRILEEAIGGVASRRFVPWVVGWPSLVPAAVAASLMAILALPALLLDWTRQLPETSSITDLQVTARDGQVVLTWTDGDQPRRIVRTTHREDLARLDRIPGEVAYGESWVDRRVDDAPIVYYVVN